MFYKIRPFIALLIFMLVPYQLVHWYGLPNEYFFASIFFFVIIGSMLFMVLCSYRGGTFLTFLHKINMYWIGFLAYLVTFTVLYFLTGWFIPISPHNAVYCILGISLILAVYSVYKAKYYKNNSVDIEIDGLAEPLVIYHAPDVHLGEFAGLERSKMLVNDINNIMPDLVIFNGDFIDARVALTSENLAPFKEAKVPLYFTFGNHDTYVGQAAIRSFFKENNINILENEIIEVKNTQILGLDHLNADEFTKDGHGSRKSETIKSILPTINIDKNKPLVIANHKPIGIPYMAEAGADLVLCGHTHNGQMFPANILSKLQFKYLKGLYNYNNTQIYVTMGVGTFGPPMRLCAEAEATIVKLIPKK